MKVVQCSNLLAAEDLRDAIDEAMGLPAVTHTHKGDSSGPVVMTQHECCIIEKPGNSPIHGVVLTEEAELVDGIPVTLPRTGEEFVIQIGQPQDFDLDGWRPAPQED